MKSPNLNITEKLRAWKSEEVFKSGQIFNVSQLKDRIMIAIKVIESEKIIIIQAFKDMFDKVMKVIETGGELL